MGKLDTNLEAYRIVAESLHRLRKFIRESLRQLHGDDWEKLGLGPARWGHLEERRERESAVSWRLPEGCDILDYSGFADLLDIALAEPEIVGRFATFVPSPELLRARFLELEVVFNRIAYARPISESELEFAVSFGERIRKALSEPVPAAPATPQALAVPVAVETPNETAPPPPAARTAAPQHPRAVGSAGAPAPRPPARPLPAATSAPAREGGERPSAGSVAAALAGGDTSHVLDALYKEITEVADTLWRSGAAADPPIWGAVRESAWYRDQFSNLGMKVVSDFYDLVKRCGDRADGETDAQAVQEFLKANNFAQLLLSLRDFFKSKLDRDRNGP